MNLLFECSIRAVLIAAAVGSVLALFRIASASARHRAWCGVLGAMLFLPAFLTWGPQAALRVLPPLAELPWVDTSTSPIVVPGPLVAQPVALPRPAEVPKEPMTPAFWFAAAYGLVASGMLIRLLMGSVRAKSVLGRATPEQGFLSSPECVCPITMGWFRPAVVVPASWREWPAGELDAVLTHEREHVRRRDPLILWVAALNRSVFWFHPLAWWLERHLASLAEEACDAAVVASGHDPADYSEYLIHQARAVQQAGARILPQGAAMVERSPLEKRIHRLLAPRAIPRLGRGRAVSAALLGALSVAAFTACRLDRAERPAAGQPTMNDLMHRNAASQIQEEEKRKALMARAQTVTAAEVPALLKNLRQNPDDQDSYWTIVRYYEFKQDVQDLDALRLWYIEHRPDGRTLPGNINPHLDRAGYDRGKALWLAHLNRPGVPKEAYMRAADFLEGDDRVVAEQVLRRGKKVYPDDPSWDYAFGRHYAQALIGSGEPLTEFNVFRALNPNEPQSEYAQHVRAELAHSTDTGVLLATAGWLWNWGRIAPGPMQLARTYVDRANSIEPNSAKVKKAREALARVERIARARQLARMAPADLATISDSDRILYTLSKMQLAGTRSPEDAAAPARELLSLAARNTKDPLYGEAMFAANLVLGKVALLHGDRKAAVRHLLAAADAPFATTAGSGQPEMNLPRALVDRGERSAVADFLDRMAPKSDRAAQFKAWAADIRKGINPNLMPTYSHPGCTQDPC